MLTLGGKLDTAIENLQSLNICPTAVSYEYNPCDILTMPELMKLAKEEKYEKAPMEDMQHMAKGIEGKKGKIAVSFGKPINPELEKLKSLKNRKEIYTGIIQLIDRVVHESYYLMPTNYIAYDLLMKEDGFNQHYSVAEKMSFQTYMESRLKQVMGDDEFIHETFLRMYANPVVNRIALGK